MGLWWRAAEEEATRALSRHMVLLLIAIGAGVVGFFGELMSWRWLGETAFWVAASCMALMFVFAIFGAKRTARTLTKGPAKSDASED